MATFNKYNCFAYDQANGYHNLGTDTLKIALVNTAPAATNTTYSGEVANGNGYTTGGNVAAFSSQSAQTATPYTITLTSPTMWTSSTGTMGPFQYAVLYNSSASAGHQLIGWWDYGSAVSLNGANGDTFTATLSGAVITLS